MQLKNLLLYPIIALCLSFFLLNLCFPIPTEVEYSSIVTDRTGSILHAFLTTDDKWRMKTELSEITPELQKAIIYKEDKYFYYHLGINPLAIFRALFNNLVQGKRTSGASTITMQVARLLEPKERNYANKFIEMFRSLQLEWQFSKKEILQLYLNLVPYGSNIEGVKSAAVLFFDKAPNHLSLAEITALSIVPNRPTSLQLGKRNVELKKARNKWLKRFEKEQVFSAEIIADALAESLTAQRKNAPKFAPHFSYRMRKQYPKQAIIKTNLDFNKQQKIEKLVSNYIKRLQIQKIQNAAILLLNNQTHQVEAYVGSADFYDKQDAGQVDGIRAVRSPGSTLKPFLYALAFDKGLITPKHKISDVPVNFSGYAPVNYNNEYNGMVTIEYALAQSLNVPSVKVLDDLGTDFFIEKLIMAGFHQIEKKKKQLGLSVVLGGCGTTLEELTRLYSSFAHAGQIAPWQWTQSDSTLTNKITPINLISPSAAFMLTDVLTQLTRPDFPKNIEHSKNLPRIAWKTGTSYGRRDAWSIGFNAHYTIGVWVGNFSGQGVSELTGATHATPLLFDIFNSIDYASPAHWFAPPRALDYRWVCSESGLPPNEHCEKQVIDLFLPLVSATQTCQHLQEVWISADETFSYCKTCAPNVGYKKKMFPVLLPEIVSFYEEEHIHYDKIPPHNPNCERIFNESALAIISPVNGLEYLLDPQDNTQLMLACNSANDAHQIYWYINDEFFVAKTAGENAFFVPKKGKNKITCIDDKGRRDDVWVEVEFL